MLNNRGYGLNGLAAVNAVSSALQHIDTRLIDHGERVAFIACKIAETESLPLDTKTLFLLSIFHDIGAYKTEEIDRMVEFETSDVTNHAIYGYLFLKYLTPLAESSEAILYHHSPWDKIKASGCEYGDYAALIHIADRMDIIYLHGIKDFQNRTLSHNDADIFRPDYVIAAVNTNDKTDIFGKLSSGEYKGENRRRVESFNVDSGLALEYLKMLVFSIDFRSEYTVTHTVNTVAITLNIAEHFGIDDSMRYKLYLGALLHDVGKIAIPTHILEFPGRLDDKQLAVMRTHAAETEKIIYGIVPDDICKIAVRHHEKLDGSGYPHGLDAEELSFPERIVAVADIVSALASKRSYKEPFPADTVRAILKDMSVSQLDPEICAYVIGNYDNIIDETEDKRDEVIDKYQSMLREYDMMRIKIE